LPNGFSLYFESFFFRLVPGGFEFLFVRLASEFFGGFALMTFALHHLESLLHAFQFLGMRDGGRASFGYWD
jgi:hypothetical protein